MLPFPPSVNPHHHDLRATCPKGGHSCPGCGACIHGYDRPAFQRPGEIVHPLASGVYKRICPNDGDCPGCERCFIHGKAPDLCLHERRLEGEIHQVEVTMSVENPNDKVNAVYVQRNELAVAFAAMALRAGFKAGRGIDESKVEGWQHVLYVDLPNGQQVSWHMSPECVELLDILPSYDGEWDKLYTATHKGWSIELGFGLNFDFDNLSVASATGKALDAISDAVGIESSAEQREQLREMFLRGGGEWEAHLKEVRSNRECRRDAAERTLSEKGYTHNGGILWKPPVGMRNPLNRPKPMDESQLALLLRHLQHPSCGLMPDLVIRIEAALTAFNTGKEFHVEQPKPVYTLDSVRVSRSKELIDFAVAGLEQGCPKADAFAATLAAIKENLERTEF